MLYTVKPRFCGISIGKFRFFNPAYRAGPLLIYGVGVVFFRRCGAGTSNVGTARNMNWSKSGTVNAA